MNERHIQLSVVMPALNEEAAIEDAVLAVLRGFETFDIPGEVIVVNDGSSDATPLIVQNLIKKDPERVRITHHERPMGIGQSYWDGVREARGDGVVMMPGDNENDPEEILRYAGFLENVDAIVPYVINKGVRPWMRNLISSLFTCVINATFLTAFKYTNGTVIYRRTILNNIACRSTGFFYQAETLVKAVKKGARIQQVPYSLAQRVGGVSKALSMKSLKNVLRGYFLLIRDVYFSR